MVTRSMTPAKVLFTADRKLDWHTGTAECVVNTFQSSLEIRAFPIQLVDEDRPGHLEFVGKSPDFLRLDLNPRDSIDDDESGIPAACKAARVSFMKMLNPGVSSRFTFVPLPLGSSDSRRNRDSSARPIRRRNR
jgi:hypothetical protein